MYRLPVLHRDHAEDSAFEFLDILPQNRKRLCSWGSLRSGLTCAISPMTIGSLSSRNGRQSQLHSGNAHQPPDRPQSFFTSVSLIAIALWSQHFGDVSIGATAASDNVDRIVRFYYLLKSLKPRMEAASSVTASCHPDLAVSLESNLCM